MGCTELCGGVQTPTHILVEFCNTFASHHYGPCSTPGCIWDVFHPSQPIPGGFPMGFSSTLRRAWNCTDWNRLIRPASLARTCSGWRKTMALPFTFLPISSLSVSVLDSVNAPLLTGTVEHHVSVVSFQTLVSMLEKSRDYVSFLQKKLDKYLLGQGDQALGK